MLILICFLDKDHRKQIGMPGWTKWKKKSGIKTKSQSHSTRAIVQWYSGVKYVESLFIL